MAQTLEHNGSVIQVTSVEIPLCEVDVEVIQKLDDEPNDVGGLSAQELKERFDHVGAELKGYLNEKLIPTVVSDDLTEQARQEAEAERVKNERERVSGEGSRAAAEEARATAEGARAAAETAREAAESGRAAAEAARTQAETAREGAEAGRETAEEARETAEAARVAAEAARVAAETSRAGAETGREAAENDRETAEAARAAAEETRVQAEAQRVDTDNGIVAQATAQAALAAENAQSAADAAQSAGASAGEAAGSAQSAAASAGAAAESTEAAADAKTGAEAAQTAAEAAKTGAEAAQTAAQTAKTAAEGMAAEAEEQAQTATAAAAQSSSEADRAKAEADRAKAIAGGDFITPVELAQAVETKADIPTVGTEALLEELPAGGVLLVTDGGSGDTAKAKQIAVKDKDGVLQVVELGGSGGKRVNGGELLGGISIDGEVKYVKPRNAMLTWAEVEALTPNTGVAPTAAEKEMFRDEDGGYTLKRIIYDGYISKDSAVSEYAVDIKAFAKDETSKVTIYDGLWNPATDNAGNGVGEAIHTMNAQTLDWFDPLRDGMDDMKVAVNATPIDYDAQQRVYIDVENGNGSAVDHYVLIIRNAKQYNNNVGLYQFVAGQPWIAGDGRRLRGDQYPDKVKAEGTQPTDCYAIWVYPADVDLSISPPNVLVSLWSDEVQAKIDAGDTGGLTEDQINTVTTYGATDEWGHPYPLAFRVRVPYCELLHVKMLAENPLSSIGFAFDPQYQDRPPIHNWTEGSVDGYTDIITLGQNTQLYGGVSTQLQSMSGYRAYHRGFTITVEFEEPAVVETALGSAAHITFPEGTGEKAYTISDGTDVKSSRTESRELFTVLRHCNATYQVTVTTGGKTYTGQIVTGPYFGECTLSEWTEVTT